MKDGSIWPVMSVAEAHARLTAPGAPFEISEAVIERVSQKVWRTGPATAQDLIKTARGHGESTFLVHGDVRVDFLAFSKAVGHLAVALRHLGVARGDRISVAMRNCPEWPVAFHRIGRNRSAFQRLVARARAGLRDPT